MEQKHRSEFPEKELWDLTALYQDREDFLRAIEKAREDINQFSRDYKGNLHTFEDFEKAFAELEQIYIQMSHIGNYAFMPQTTDYSNDEFANIAQAGMEFETAASVALTFFDDALVAADEEVLDRLGKLPHLTAAIRQAKIKKAHYLGADVEKALTNLGEVFTVRRTFILRCELGILKWLTLKPMARPTKTALSPMRISTKITRMLRFVRNPSVPSQRDFVSTKIRLQQPIWLRSSLKNSWLI